MLHHLPVMLHETMDLLEPRPGKVIVDCTVGYGGHAAELLRHRCTVIGLDMDPQSLAIARERLKEIGDRFRLFHANFAALPKILAEAGVERVHGILADLGVASPQIDDPARGFSYLKPGPLDMRMDPTRGKPAWRLLDRISEEELVQALLELGDETDAASIARLLVRRRPIRTTQELTAIVCEARRFTLERARGAKLHPAARTFQALRILVNRELANLERLLVVVPEYLQSGGIAVFLSFHSGEDRLVKKAFQNSAHYSERWPLLVPSEEERRQNPRARSAKLRGARRA